MNGSFERRAADAGRSRPSARLALLSILGFWAVYFLLATARAGLSGLPEQDEMLLRRSIVTLVAMGLTGLLWLLLRRQERAATGRLLTIAFVASVPLALAYATVNYIAFYVFPIASHAEKVEKYEAMDPMAAIAGSALEWYFFIACWAVMWVAISWGSKVRAAEQEAAWFRQAAQEAELRALRYQVNPHFLFNTLNSLSSLVLRGRAEEAERMILNLSTFFRASLTRAATDDVPLAEEVRLQLLYLDIEKVRFPERLVVHLAVPDALGDALVPALILQPLVENAIKHGVAASSRPVCVSIRAEAVAGRLQLEVHDDAPATAGSPSGNDAPAGCGVGLANVGARLTARFGDHAGLAAGPGSAGGFAVRLWMPLERG